MKFEPVGSKMGLLGNINVLKGFWSRKKSVWVENRAFREN